MTLTDGYHQPVMVDEAVGLLNIRPAGNYIDATAGGGGYTVIIASQLGPSGRLLAIDRDVEAVEQTRERNRELLSHVDITQGNFSDMANLASTVGITAIDGVVFDLGVSGHQFDCAERGFSYRQDGPLDFRMDRSQGLTAADIINNYPQEKLNNIFYTLGEEKNARRIASVISNSRTKKEITTTFELVKIIKSVTNPRYLNKTLSRCFQAIRIVVNEEIESLNKGLQVAIGLLAPAGRIVVLSYHSLEDRLVKNIFRERKQNGDLQILTKKPLIAKDQEKDSNPRSRSVKLRAAEKI
ncbi:MAG: 16S rRNA (cytosine(1402)-N(4))-methyltransferase RsmH [candidate division Zixibacteria bacterium]